MAIACAIGLVLWCFQVQGRAEFNPERVYADSARELMELELGLQELLLNPTPDNVETMLRSAAVHYQGLPYFSKQVGLILGWISLLDVPERPLPGSLAQEVLTEIGRYAKRYPPDQFATEGSKSGRVTLVFSGVEGPPEQVSRLGDHFPIEADLLFGSSPLDCMARRELWPCITVNAAEISEDTYLVFFSSTCTFHGVGIYRISHGKVMALARDFPSSPHELEAFQYYP